MTGIRADLTEANRERAREAFDAWREGTAPITDLFAPKMVWRIEGSSPASKKYGSRQQFVNEVLAPFAARFATSPEPFRPVAIHAIHADGDTVIVRWDGRGIANDGRPYENSYAWFMTMRDGQVVDATAFFDTRAFDELWTRVTPL